MFFGLRVILKWYLCDIRVIWSELCAVRLWLIFQRFVRDFVTLEVLIMERVANSSNLVER